MQLAEGHIVAEHYKLIRPLGHGSFGDVWLAHNMLADIDVAIKFYGILDQKGLEEFRNEFKIAYKLHHPNLLSINHIDVYENCPYLVMPYCENGSVSRQNGNMPESEIWKFILDVSGGLTFLHNQQPPIVHQDIKPDNILITSDGRYVISDFGISRRFRTQMSRTNNNFSSSGTIAYMGPERFSEKPMVVLASDIWAFGMTLYELMTGDVLWEGMGGCVQLSGARLPIISGAFSNELKQLVTACLAAETWNRPTAAQIHEYASAYIQKKTLPPLSIEKQVQKPIQKPSQPTIPPTTEVHTHTYGSHHDNPESHTNFQHSFKQFKNDNQSLKRGLLIALAVLAAIGVITGIVKIISNISEEEAFLSCRSKQDYEQFIKEYPSSSYLEKAKQRIASMTRQESSAQEGNPQPGMQKPTPQPEPSNKEELAPVQYITESPQKKAGHTREATEPPLVPEKTIIKTPSKTQTSEDDRVFYRCRTSKDYHAYITQFPNGRHRKEAEQCLTELLNQNSGNEINLNSNDASDARFRTDMPTGGQSIRQQSINVGTGVSFGGQNRGYRGGGGSYSGSGPRGGGGHRSTRSGSSHRHSN